MKNIAIAQFKLDRSQLVDLSAEEHEAFEQHSGWTEDQGGTFYSPGLVLPEVTSAAKVAPKRLELPLEKIKNREVQDRLRKKLTPVTRFQLALFDFSLYFVVMNGRAEVMDGTVVNGLGERVYVTSPHFNHVEQLKKMLYHPPHQVKGKILGVHYVHFDSPDLEDGIFTVLAKKYRSVNARTTEVREMMVLQHSFTREEQGVVYQPRVVSHYSASSQMLMNLDPFLSNRFLEASHTTLEDHLPLGYRDRAFASEGSSIDYALLPLGQNQERMEKQVRTKLKYPAPVIPSDPVQAPLTTGMAVAETEMPTSVTEARYWVSEVSVSDAAAVKTSAGLLKSLLEEHERKVRQPGKNKTKHQQELKKVLQQLEHQLVLHQALMAPESAEALPVTEASVPPTTPPEVTPVSVAPQVHPEPASVPTAVMKAPHPPVDPLARIHQELAVDPDLLSSVMHYLSGGQNVILVGPPGCGKTRLATLLALARCGTRGKFIRSAHEQATDYRCHGTWHCTPQCSQHTSCFATEPNYTVVTADPRWSSVHLVGGLRVVPGEGLKYRYEDGIVTRAVKAHNHSEKAQGAPHDLIIDEINRANLDEAFGSLFTVLEEGQRSTVPISSLEDNGERDVFMGSTFRIIGTMNDQDSRSLHQVGNALKRRFVMVHMGIPQQEPQWISGQGFSPLLVERLYRFVGDHSHWEGRLTAGEVKLRSFYPLGTSFLLDVLNISRAGTVSLDRALADKVIPQLEHLHEQQIRQLMELAVQQDLKVTAERLHSLL